MARRPIDSWLVSVSCFPRDLSLGISCLSVSGAADGYLLASDSLAAGFRTLIVRGWGSCDGSGRRRIFRAGRWSGAPSAALVHALALTSVPGANSYPGPAVFPV